MTVSNRTYLADVLVTALAFMLAVFILSAVGVALKAKNYVRVPLLVRITGLLGVASGAACASLVAWCMYTFPDNITPIPWNEPWSNVVDGKAFSLHPFLMTLAFGLLGPFAAISYCLFDGLPPMFVKVLHGLSHASAIVCAGLGIAAVWYAHSSTPRETESFWPHFESMHSWLGIGAAGFYTFCWIPGTLLLPNLKSSKRAQLVGMHKFIGKFAVFFTLSVIPTGILSLIGRDDPSAGEPKPHADSYKAEMKYAGVLCVTTAFLVAATLALPGRAVAPKATKETPTEPDSYVPLPSEEAA
mmetsp:Transcript_8713/g.32140  ORF Transcript_8713/g.32140 Transcript_8713/m.32140 type:complete len:300 (+) Transcript_8713:81-980(+)